MYLCMVAILDYDFMHMIFHSCLNWTIYLKHHFKSNKQQQNLLQRRYKIVEPFW